MITKQQLNEALEAWSIAQERALREQAAFGLILQGHKALIASMREHGHTWVQAQTAFGKLTDQHREALLSAWEHMDVLCREYQSLLTKFTSQP